MKKILFGLLLLTGAGRSAWAAGAAVVPAAAPPASAAPAGAEVRTATAAVPTPSTVYSVEHMRDPFSVPAPGGKTSAVPFTRADFNIHNLSLRGIMKDSAADYALFTDNIFGVTFILRKGKLYDSRNKPVPGITGSLRIAQKWAQLETPDRDVQIFRLGEEEKE